MKKLSILTRTLTGVFLLAATLTITLPTPAPSTPIPPNSIEENGDIPCSDFDEPPIRLQ